MKPSPTQSNSSSRSPASQVWLKTSLMSSSGGLHRKLVVLGFRAVGKSSLTKQFVEKRFTENYDPTIENTFRTKVQIKKVCFDCDILDTAGQDEYSSISHQASIGIHGYILCFSITSRHSLNNIKLIHERLLNLIGTEVVPCVLVGSKCDLDHQREVSEEEGRRLARTWGCKYIECSAKRNLNVTEVFHTLIEAIEKDTGLLHDSEGPRCSIL